MHDTRRVSATPGLRAKLPAVWCVWSATSTRLSGRSKERPKYLLSPQPVISGSNSQASARDRGRFVAVPRAYRNRTGNSQKCCLAGDLMRRVEQSRLIVRRLSRDS